MKKLITCIGFLFLFCISITGKTQEIDNTKFTVRYKLPVVETNDDGLKCLNTEQWDRVILIASEYKGLFEWRTEVKGIVTDYQFIEARYQNIIHNYELQLKIYAQRNEYLTLRLDKERERALSLSTEDRLQKYAMWAVILAETVVIGVMGVKMMTETGDHVSLTTAMVNLFAD